MSGDTFFPGLLCSSFRGGLSTNVQAKDLAVPNAAPQKIRLIPDEWHIRNVGRLSDGRLFVVDSNSIMSPVSREILSARFFSIGTAASLSTP